MKTQKSKTHLSSLFITLTLLTILSISISAAAAVVSGCPPPSSGGSSRSRNRNSCKTCVSEQLKYDCPKCVPLLRCMARCLWGGASQKSCMATCGCDAANPSLSNCKRCVSRCKCSCVA